MEGCDDNESVRTDIKSSVGEVVFLPGIQDKPQMSIYRNPLDDLIWMTLNQL